MGQQHFEAFAERGSSQNHGGIREEVWTAFMANCARREAEAVSREQVLRELLDDAHARIRSLEAALHGLEGVVTGDLPDDASLQDE